jgi:tetratricopeptide (TPR) repeat protein
MSRLDDVLQALDRRRRPRAQPLGKLAATGRRSRRRLRAVPVLTTFAVATAVGAASSFFLAGPRSPQPRLSPEPVAMPASPVPAAEPAPAPSPLTAQANAAARGRDWEEARRLYERALALEPGNVDALNGLGVTLTRSGDRAKGLEALRRAVRLAPGHLEANRNLAVALDHEGQTREATEYYRAFLAASGDGHPERAAVHQRLNELASGRAPGP